MEEAFELFVENSLYYQEDIVFMPLACFRYYVLAYANYLHSEKSQGDSDGASCFFGVVRCRSADIRSSSAELRAVILKTLGRLREHQEWYEADEAIYGNFRDHAESCRQQIEA